MRSTMDQAVLRDEAGAFVGVNLGADFCSEHEWGIKEIKRVWGIPEKPTKKVCGFAARKVTCAAPLHYIEDDKYTYLASYDMGSWSKEPVTAKTFELFLTSRKYATGDLACAWNEKSWCIRGKGPERRVDLDTLREALTQLNACIFLGGGGPFQNGGLKVVVFDRIPIEARTEAERTDRSHMRLVEADEKTGIKDKLRAAKKEYFALSPRWNDPEDESKGFSYWLNPYDQDKNNANWCTLADLEDWIKGVGKIPKSQHQLDNEARQRREYARKERRR
jgi:hypothetical protein